MRFFRALENDKYGVTIFAVNLAVDAKYEYSESSQADLNIGVQYQLRRASPVVFLFSFFWKYKIGKS